MTDTISRQAVEDLIMETDPFWCEGMTRAIFEGVKRLPTIEPKPGKWERRGIGGWRCSVCNEQAPFWCMASTQNLSNYCPNCGAKMGGDDWEEPEINPCLGCDDYDGRGGCKSNGGCGAERSEE